MTIHSRIHVEMDAATTGIGSLIRSFLRDRGGQDIIEYGMLAALISIVVLASLLLFSDPINTLYGVVLRALELTSTSLSH